MSWMMLEYKGNIMLELNIVQNRLGDLTMNSFIKFGKTKTRDNDSNYGNSSIRWEDIKLTEEQLLRSYQSFLEEGYKTEDFSIEHRSQEYTTLFYKAYWIARLKWTPDTKWIKIASNDGDQVLYLQSEKDISEKASISKQFIEYINQIEENRHSFSDEEQMILNDIRQIFLSCGFEKDNIEYVKMSGGLRISEPTHYIYISIKIYKRKKNQVLLRDEKGQEKAYEFDSISDIETVLEDYLKKRRKS